MLSVLKDDAAGGFKTLLWIVFMCVSVCVLIILCFLK